MTAVSISPTSAVPSLQKRNAGGIPGIALCDGWGRGRGIGISPAARNL